MESKKKTHLITNFSMKKRRNKTKKREKQGLGEHYSHHKFISQIHEQIKITWDQLIEILGSLAYISCLLLFSLFL